ARTNLQHVAAVRIPPRFRRTSWVALPSLPHLPFGQEAEGDELLAGRVAVDHAAGGPWAEDAVDFAGGLSQQRFGAILLGHRAGEGSGQLQPAWLAGLGGAQRHDLGLLGGPAHWAIHAP